MAHGDRLTAQDLTVDTSIVPRFGSDYDLAASNIVSTPDGVYLHDISFTNILFFGSNSLGGYDSRQSIALTGTYLDRFDGDNMTSGVYLDSNRLLVNTGGNIRGINTFPTYSLLTNFDNTSDYVGHGMGLGLDGTNVYGAFNLNLQLNPLVYVWNISTQARQSSLEFSSDDIPSDVKSSFLGSNEYPPGVAIKDNILTIFNRNGRGFSFNKTTKAREPDFDMTLSDPFASIITEGTPISQAPGQSVVKVLTSVTSTTFTVRAYEYVPSAQTALDEIARVVGGEKKTYIHLIRGGHSATQKIYRGSDEIWTPGDLPTITSFTATPNTLDLDTATGNITLRVAGTDFTDGKFINKRTGEVVVTFSTTTNTASVSTPIPNQTTTYSVVVRNEHGSASRDVTVTATKNPGITNLRQTGFIQSRTGAQAGTYRFAATIEGLPQPSLRYSFTTGEQGAITARHLTQTGPTTWTLDWSIYFGSTAARSLTLTATNSSGTATATVATS